MWLKVITRQVVFLLTNPRIGQSFPSSNAAQGQSEKSRITINIYLLSDEWVQHTCIQEKWLPCKAIPIAEESTSGHLFWENVLKWIIFLVPVAQSPRHFLWIWVSMVSGSNFNEYPLVAVKSMSTVETHILEGDWNKFLNCRSSMKIIHCEYISWNTFKQLNKCSKSTHNPTHRL